ncbi:MAG: hypothetical protein K2K41_02850 [Ruminiclostridium sp.]|nr:hypothetical protein [Ruminiclostridium sp.]
MLDTIAAKQAASALSKAIKQNAAQAKQIAKTAEQQSDKKKDGFIGDCPDCQCEKCRSRRYQDGSNDSRVSFQMPTVMDPVKARSRVMSHEMEHVRSEQHKAKQENKVVVSQSVRIMNDRCEECGRNYVKGGFTRTITRPKLEEFRKVVSGTLEDNPKKTIGKA